MDEHKSQSCNFTWYAHQSVEKILGFLKTSEKNGLSSSDVAQNTKKFGPNIIKGQETTLWDILFNQIKSPFIYLLVAIALIDFALKDYPDGFMILVLVVINTLFSFYQEFRTHNALQTLQKYIVDHIHVVRDGKEVVISTEELVPGDIINLYTGDKIPADVRFISIQNMLVDESMLTGETAPVKKNEATVKQQEVTVYNASNIGFSGTIIVGGNGTAVVFGTGNHSYFGSIATKAKESPKQTSFLAGITKLSRFILIIVITTVTIVFILHLVLHHEHLDIVNLLTFSMALGISIIPEALPVIITFSLARGAVHLAKYKIIIKRLSAIEDLGSMTVLCIDKTGTITENKLKLGPIFGKDEQQIYLYNILTSGLSAKDLEKDTGFNGPIWQKLDDKHKKSFAHFHMVAEHPFEAKLRYSSILMQHGEKTEIIVRGNCEELLPLCTGLTDAETKEIYCWAQKQGENGHRVLLVAKKEMHGIHKKITPEMEKGLEFIGLVSYEDPLKRTAQEALTKAAKLGVKIKVISGDTKEVNYAVAHKINLIQHDDQIITGEKFMEKNEPDKLRAIHHCRVFAHVVPDQKVEIVKALENTYDVGYLGDGINDAPALKNAHVSIAVNTAADIARDMADIILLEKSLHVIVDGIYEGRKIFANCVKYIKSTLAANFGHFYSLAIISLFIDFLPMRATQLLLVSLMTDLPLIAISTDTVSFQDIKTPKKYDLKGITLITMFLGIIVMMADFIIFYLFYNKADHAILQTNWFITSILIELSFFYSIRTRMLFFKAQLPSKEVMIMSLIMASVAIMLPFTSFGQSLLYFKAPTAHDLVLIFAVTIGYFLITDVAKVLFYRVHKSRI